MAASKATLGRLLNFGLRKLLVGILGKIESHQNEAQFLASAIATAKSSSVFIRQARQRRDGRRRRRHRVDVVRLVIKVSIACNRRYQQQGLLETRFNKTSSLSSFFTFNYI